MVSGPQGKGAMSPLMLAVISRSRRSGSGIICNWWCDSDAETGASVNLVGDGAVVAEVDGNEYALDGSITQTNTGSVITNEADISSPLNNAKGFITRNQGLLINSGNIDFTTGTDNIGVWVDNGRFENTGSRIAVNGVALFVEGEHAQITSTGGISSLWMVRLPLLGAGASLNPQEWPGNDRRSEKCAWHPAGYRGCGAGY